MNNINNRQGNESVQESKDNNSVNNQKEENPNTKIEKPDKNESNNENGLNNNAVNNENLNEEDSSDDDNKMIINNYEYESYEDQSPSPQETNKNCGTNMAKNSTIVEEEKNESNLPDKTIFSKLAEDMYEKVVKNYKMANENFTYEEFINDQYLAIYSHKLNGNNQEIIKNFIERNEQYNSQKNYVEQTKQNRIGQVEETEDNLFKEYNKRVYSEEEVKKFEDEQKKFLERKNKKIEELKKKRDELINKEIRDRPKILHKKLPMFKKTNNKIEKETKHKKNKSISVFKSNVKGNNNITVKNKKLTNKDIEVLVNKLSNENKHKIKESKSCTQFKSKISLVSMSSNKLIFTNLYSQIKEVIERITSSKVDNNPNINEDQFLLILHNLNFTIEQSLNKAWKYLLSLCNKEQSEEITSSLLVCFVLSLYGLVDEILFPYVKSNLPWINFDEKFPINFAEAKKINVEYRDLYNSRNEIMKIEKENKKNSSKEIHKNCQTLTKSNISHSRIKSKGEGRLNLSESYDIILKKRENRIKKRNEEERLKIEKDCTFKPQLVSFFREKKNSRQTSVDETSKRLYLSRGKQRLKAEIEKAKAETTYTFKPELTEFKENIFNSEPLDEDYNVRKQIQRYHRAREEKFEKQNNSSFLKRDGGGMRFDNEKKIYKDSFDKFGNKPNNSNKIKKRKVKEPLLTFEIKIRNKIEILNYYYGEAIEEVAENFTKKNHLSSESKRQIINAITSKLKK